MTIAQNVGVVTTFIAQVFLLKFALNDLPHVMGMYDWATQTEKFKPAITGYVFHNTRMSNALEIIKAGYIKPSVGSISFTLDPCFTVAYPSVSFAFSENTIREKYSGKEPEYLIHYTREEIKKIWEREMEVEVKAQLVYMSDCVEILEGRDVCWKYGYGYKYHYIDVRERKGKQWEAFREAAPLI